MTPIRFALLAAFFILAGTVACEDETGPQGGSGGAPSAGYGGGAGTGGTTYVPPAGTGGSAGAPVSGIYPPVCLETLFAQCPAEGGCTFETAGGFRLRSYCYDSGVRFDFQYSSLEGTECKEGDQTTMRASRSDGSPCYTQVTTTGPECTSSTITWTDSGGNTVATASASKDPVLGTTTQTINCSTGESASCLAGSNCLTFSCQQGVCP